MLSKKYLNMIVKFGGTKEHFLMSIVYAKNKYTILLT